MNANAGFHLTLRTLNRLLDSYNNGTLQNSSISTLKNFQDWAFEGLKLMNFLKSKAETADEKEAAETYIVFCKKLVLRLSYLIYHGRTETQSELANHFLKKENSPELEKLLADQEFNEGSG